MRKTTLIALALLPLAGLGACASHREAMAPGTSEMAKLEQDCKARGGFLKPRMGRQTAYVALDNYCDVTRAPDPSGAMTRETR